MALIVAVVAITGCNKPATSPTSVPQPNVTSLPARLTTTPPPPFKLFHQTDNSLTLVTDEHVTDDQIATLIWQLHDAAQIHTFDRLGIPQKFIDARDPIVWFHIYRGAKCASEKYTSAKLPCGGSYHAAGDYTLGGFTDHNHDDGTLLHDEDHETHLW